MASLPSFSVRFLVTSRWRITAQIDTAAGANTAEPHNTTFLTRLRLTFGKPSTSISEIVTRTMPTMVMRKRNEIRMASYTDRSRPVTITSSVTSLLIGRACDMLPTIQILTANAMPPVAVYRKPQPAIPTSCPNLTRRRLTKSSISKTNKNILPTLSASTRHTEISFTISPVNTGKTRLTSVDSIRLAPPWQPFSSGP